ncbi:MAG TPA: hypothetical protein VL970_00440 [Candidatus Acidoferrales bacterium]|nr:hypothetical protein [Candidatus Acidoferrales bacterium]
MARAQYENSSLRFSRAEMARLVVALLLSVLLHLSIWGGYHMGDKAGWWQRWRLPTWLQIRAKESPVHPRTAQNEEPMIFVDVSHADADAPRATKYYSDRNSRAANPDTADSNIPRIEGRQRDMPKTEDVARPTKAASPKAEQATKEPPAEASREHSNETSDDTRKADEKRDLAKLQPSLPPPSLTPTDQTETRPGPQTPGETELRPKRILSNPSHTTSTASAAAARPRTIRQALAQRDQIPGQRMQQESGVARHAMSSSLDVRSTPFGEYDRAIVEAVSQRWYDLLDSRRFADDRTGKVTLRFKLKPDGSIIEMQTLDNTVGELLGYLCQEAIEEAAPFAKWPPDMARMIGSNSRDITFTFYYY